MRTHPTGSTSGPDPVTADGGIVRLGATPGEYLSAFLPSFLGLCLAWLLIAVGGLSRPVRPVTIVGLVLAAICVVLALLEVRDLPRRTIRWNRGGITLQARRLPTLALPWSELGVVRTVVQPDRLWWVLPRTRVWLECQPLDQPAGFDTRHPELADYESPAADEGYSAVRLMVGLGNRRARRVDMALRGANPTYRGLRHLPPARRSRPGAGTRQRGARLHP